MQSKESRSLNVSWERPTITVKMLRDDLLRVRTDSEKLYKLLKRLSSMQWMLRGESRS